MLLRVIACYRPVSFFGCGLFLFAATQTGRRIYKVFSVVGGLELLAGLGLVARKDPAFACLQYRALPKFNP